MKKQIWEIGGMSSNFPQRITAQKIATQEDELYLAFEALEDGEIVLQGKFQSVPALLPLWKCWISKDNKTWTEVELIDEDSYVIFVFAVNKGETVYCKSNWISGGNNKLQVQSSMPYNVSGNVNALFKFNKEYPDWEDFALNFMSVAQQIHIPSDKHLFLQRLGEYGDVFIFRFRQPNEEMFALLKHLDSTITGTLDDWSKPFMQNIPAEMLVLPTEVRIWFILLQYLTALNISIYPECNGLFANDYCVDASKLSVPCSTTGAGMFYNSTLKYPPVLSDTYLATRCYERMFAYTPIEYAPDLLAPWLVSGCYDAMFANTSIKNIKMLGTRYDTGYDPFGDEFAPDNAIITVLKDADLPPTFKWRTILV